MPVNWGAPCATCAHKIMFRSLVLALAMLWPLQLGAIEGLIAISEVHIHSKSISVRFKGHLEQSSLRFDQVYLLDLRRPDTLSDAEWSSLQEELKAKKGKTVKLDIPSKTYASRGAVLTVFDLKTVTITEVK